jgi:hypothetical protein
LMEIKIDEAALDRGDLEKSTALQDSA